MEETKRTIHRYGLLLKRLGLSAVELDGKTPEESERVFEDALTELRSRRTEAEILYASGAAVRLAGKDYEIKPLPIDRDLAWRQACARVAQDVMDVVFEMADTGKDAPAVVAARQRLYEAEYAKDEAAIAAAREALQGAEQAARAEKNKAVLRRIVPYVLTDGLEKAVELLFAYSPELKEAEAEIRATAPSHELVEAAMTALEMALPFVAGVVRGAMRVAKRAKEAGIRL